MSDRYRGYEYDAIGNRINTPPSVYPHYCTNALNEYLTLDDSTTCPATAPVNETFAYDDDGNMTQDQTYDYAWDAENRLVAVQTRLSLGLPRCAGWGG